MLFFLGNNSSTSPLEKCWAAMPCLSATGCVLRKHFGRGVVQQRGGTLALHAGAALLSEVGGF